VKSGQVHARGQRLARRLVIVERVGEDVEKARDVSDGPFMRCFAVSSGRRCGEFMVPIVPPRAGRGLIVVAHIRLRPIAGACELAQATKQKGGPR
jgi:hypothetical protein